MPKLDLKKDLKHLYNPSAKAVSVVDVPSLNFLMIDGHGDPNTAPAYVDAIQALYAVAYGLKFKVKQSKAAVDFAVMPLEGLWWVDDMRLFSEKAKDDWDWTMMIAQPKPVTARLVAEAVSDAQKKKDLPALSKLRFEAYHEGLAVQIMHLGPYAAEGPNIARLHAYIEANGGQRRGKHHEIYLSDARRTAPEKLKTVVRQPFER